MFIRPRIVVCILLIACNFFSLSSVAFSEGSRKKAPALGSQITPNDDLAPEAVTFTNSTPTPIPDDGYIGTLGGGFGVPAGMSCSIITVGAPVVPAGAVVSNVSVSVTITHTWIGDLTMKLQGPNGVVLTILNRPGSNVADDGTDAPVGDSSNWNNTPILFGDGAGPEAETMGAGITDAQNICTDNGVCAHDPSPDTAVTPPSAFNQLNDQLATGEWTLCVGDSLALDTGTLSSWSLILTFATVLTASPMGTVPDDGYTGGFGGPGQFCSTIDTTGLLPSGSTNNNLYLNVDMSHTWVGDLTMKLRSPTGTILTFLNRPGSNAPDTGGGGAGDGADWVAGTFLQFRDGIGPEAETMGAGLANNQQVCLDNGICRFDPSPDTATQPPSAFSAFNGQTAIGAWTLCVGDSMPTDVGQLRSWRIKFPNLLAPTAAGVNISGRVWTPLGSSISKARVKLVGVDGSERTALTSSFGQYFFDDVTAGETYLISVEAKGYVFESRTVSVADEVSDLDFVGKPALFFKQQE